MTTAMAVAARPGASALAQDRRLNWLRTFLPLLAANLAVLAFVLLDGRHGNLRAGAGLCLGASSAPIRSRLRSQRAVGSAVLRCRAWR